MADDGNDLNATTYVHGIVALWGERWKGQEDELLKSSKRAYSKALETGARVTYDSIGVGAQAGAKFAELNEEREAQGLAKGVSYNKFNAGAKVCDPDGFYIDTRDEKITNKDFFSNLKAQSWCWSLTASVTRPTRSVCTPPGWTGGSATRRGTLSP